MRTLVIEQRPEGTVLALLHDRLLTDYRVIHETALRSETVMLGRVRQNVRGMGAAFISLPDGQVGFLPESEARQPLHPGDFVLVQVKKPPSGTKGAYLTQEITLAGRGSILLPLSGALAVSGRVEADGQRERLLAAACALRPAGMGLIMRRQALNMTEGELQNELRLLQRRWSEISALAAEPDAPAILWPGRSALEQALEDFGIIDRLILDHEVSDAPPHEVRLHPFSDFAVEEQRERLLRRQIWLPSGGFIVVDPCEALTAIDVNTGKSVGKKTADREQLFLSTNSEAADMIARVLRVRGIGGIVIVDLIDMETEAARQAVLERFRTLLLEDPVKCTVYGYTALGLLEISRKKS